MYMYCIANAAGSESCNADVSKATRTDRYTKLHQYQVDHLFFFTFYPCSAAVHLSCNAGGQGGRHDWSVCSVCFPAPFFLFFSCRVVTCRAPGYLQERWKALIRRILGEARGTHGTTRASWLESSGEVNNNTRRKGPPFFLFCITVLSDFPWDLGARQVPSRTSNCSACTSAPLYQILVSIYWIGLPALPQLHDARLVDRPASMSVVHPLP